MRTFGVRTCCLTATCARRSTPARHDEPAQVQAVPVAALGDDAQKWRARQAEVFGAFGGSGSGPFAPLPPPNRSPPKYRVTKTLTRPGYTCELVLYETRPGFFASGSIWTVRC